jgi:hypothetical protein
MQFPWVAAAKERRASRNARADKVVWLGHTGPIHAGMGLLPVHDTFAMAKAVVCLQVADCFFVLFKIVYSRKLSIAMGERTLACAVSTGKRKIE